MLSENQYNARGMVPSSWMVPVPENRGRVYQVSVSACVRREVLGQARWILDSGLPLSEMDKTTSLPHGESGMHHLHCTLDGDVPGSSREKSWHHFPGLTAGGVVYLTLVPDAFRTAGRKPGFVSAGGRGWMSCLPTCFYTQTVPPRRTLGGGGAGRVCPSFFFRMDMIGCFLFLAVSPGGTRIDGVAGSTSGRLGGQSLEGWAKLERSGGWAGQRKLGGLSAATGAGRARRAGRDRWTCPQKRISESGELLGRHVVHAVESCRREA